MNNKILWITAVLLVFCYAIVDAQKLQSSISQIYSDTVSQHKEWYDANIQTPQPSVGTIVHYKRFPSKYISSRNVDVWLPDNYEPNKNFAVLYMHDGQMLFDTNYTWNRQEWGVDEAIDSLIKLKKIRNTIVVGIYSNSNRATDYFPQNPFYQLTKNYQDSMLKFAKTRYSKMWDTTVQSDNYLKFIVYELKPFIDSVYLPATDKQNTFIMGSSMGGLISWYAVCEYPQIFGGAACLSTHWIGVFDTSVHNKIPNLFVDYLSSHLKDTKKYKLYFDYGTETLDKYYPPSQRKVDSMMHKKKFDANHWITLKFEGADHTENSWRKRLDIPLIFLLKP